MHHPCITGALLAPLSHPRNAALQGARLRRGAKRSGVGIGPTLEKGGVFPARVPTRVPTLAVRRAARSISRPAMTCVYLEAVVARSRCPAHSPTCAHETPARCHREIRRWRRSCGLHKRRPGRLASPSDLPAERRLIDPREHPAGEVADSSRGTSASTAAKTSAGTGTHRPRADFSRSAGDAPPLAGGVEVAPGQRLQLARPASRSRRAPRGAGDSGAHTRGRPPRPPRPPAALISSRRARGNFTRRSGRGWATRRA